MRYAGPRTTERSSNLARATGVTLLVASLLGAGCSSFTAEDALSVTDSYFDEYNAGNYEAVVALLTPAVDINFFGPITPAEFEELTAFFTGMGTTLTPPDCRVTEEVSGESGTVRCAFETIDGRTQAVGAPGVPSTFTAVVTPDGIEQLFFAYGSPDFLHVGRPLESWIAEHRPDAVEATQFGEWTTVEEARETGEATARLANEWAAFLQENGCSYTDPVCGSDQ